MVKTIYVDLGDENQVLGWGSSSISNNCVEIKIDEKHEFFQSNPFEYYYKNSSLEKMSPTSNVILKNMSEIKKQELNSNCQKAILSGFNCELKGLIYHFSYDLEAQLNFQDTYNLFQNNLLSEIGWTIRFNEEKKRILLAKDDFLTAYTQAIKHKNETLDHLYNVALVSLEAAADIDAINAVIWGVPGENLQFSTANMLDAKLMEIDGISKEAIAQKDYNTYTESMMMEVISIALM